MQQSIDKLKRNFEQHNMAVFQVSNSQELLTILNEFIKDGTAVGCRDSVTLEQTGVFDYLRKRDIVFLDKYRPGLSHEDKRAIYLRNFTADTFITGTNAITMDGKIFNIDGNSSRVAPMIYGPEQVIIVVGTNKITGNVDEAIKRVRQIAAPLDAKRLGKGTPCAKLGRCIDCNHKERICNDFVLIANQFLKDRIKIIIVDQELGY
ncbi:MAG: lactate utilization protein [Negativicutes bacterium]|nr:lactate utilization protein [Negativicutes bacterium]